MMGHPINKDVQWVDHTCKTSTCIKGCTTSIWGLHPDTSTHIVSYLLLFGLIWRECIDTFQSDAVAMNQVGRGSQRQHTILRGNIVPIDCRHYRLLFPCCNPFHALMTSFRNAITGGDMRTTEMQSDSQFESKNLPAKCCVIVNEHFSQRLGLAEQSLQVADNACSILSSQMMPN